MLKIQSRVLGIMAWRVGSGQEVGKNGLPVITQGQARGNEHDDDDDYDYDEVEQRGKIPQQSPAPPKIA
jgi:hypothetical protein